MDELTVSRGELQALLATAVVIPVCSFYFGFLTAGQSIERFVDLSEQFSEESKNSPQGLGPEDAQSAENPVHQLSLKSTRKESGSTETDLLIEQSPAVQDITHANADARETSSVEPRSVSIDPAYVVQAAAFSTSDNAERFLDGITFSDKDLDAKINYEVIGDKPFYRVIVGTFESRDNAVSFQNEFTKLHGIKGLIREVGGKAQLEMGSLTDAEKYKI